MKELTNDYDLPPHKSRSYIPYPRIYAKCALDAPYNVSKCQHAIRDPWHNFARSVPDPRPGSGPGHDPEPRPAPVPRSALLQQQQQLLTVAIAIVLQLDIELIKYSPGWRLSRRVSVFLLVALQLTAALC